MHDPCYVCGKELHSITTTSIGNFFVCNNCRDEISPLIQTISDEVLKHCKAGYTQHKGRDLDVIVDTLAKYYGVRVI